MAKKQIIEMIGEGVELGFDQVVENSLLKDIPIIGSISKIYDASRSIRDQIYTKKIQEFLVALDSVPNDKKREFSVSMMTDGEDIERLTQKILLVIENQSDIEKSEIIANLFVAYLDKQVSNSDFRRALDVTNTCFLDDIRTFLEDGRSKSHNLGEYSVLESKGLADLINSPLIEENFDESYTGGPIQMSELAKAKTYKKSSFGKKFIDAYLYGGNLRNLKF